MIQNAVKMACGNCGHAKCYVYDVPFGLVIECCACKSTTEVKAIAKLRVEMADDSQGGLCIVTLPKD